MIDTQIHSQGICTYMLHLNRSDAFLMPLSIVAGGALIFTLLSLVIALKFDRLLKPYIDNYPYFARFFEFPGNRFLNINYRSNIYMVYIQKNAVQRLQRLEQKRQQEQLTEKELKQYAKCKRLADKFFGFDFRAHASWFDIFIIKGFDFCGILLFLLAIPVAIGRLHCGIQP